MASSILQNTQSSFIHALYTKFNAPNAKQKTAFFRLLALSQKAGLGIRESLISIRKTEKQPGLLYFIDDVIDQLTQGSTFSHALKKHTYLFKQQEIALIKSAETIGNLPQVLQDLSGELENDERIMAKVKKATTYPIVLLLFSVIAIVVLLLFVIPNIVSMFPSEQTLPGITVFMINTSNFIKNNGFYIFILLAGIYVAYTFAYKYILPFKIFVDRIMIVTPVVSDVTKSFYMYRFSTVLGQLYTGGISPVLSLKIIADIFENYHYKKKVIEIGSDLRSGFSMAESMDGSDLFDPILIQIVHVGEDTGNMADVLTKISSFYNQILGDKIDALLGMLEPILMVFIATIVGTVVGAVFIPMADMVNVMQ